ncbi:MAG TPA: hypothetical protein VFR02_03655 [bacterium]|nr:hypothetical protein [bacterium]
MDPRRTLQAILHPELGERPFDWAPLFLVSAASLGFEVQLTRYFAIASWSEYGYWVISIAMVGLAAGGVLLSLAKDHFRARADRVLFWIPFLLMPAAAFGFGAATWVPFNPLEFQNPDLWFGQLVNIWKYYAVLFPFFFLTGLYVGLSFLRFTDRIPSVYAADLMGAGAGSLLLMGLLYLVHPFHLLPFLLALPLGAALLGLRGLASDRRRLAWFAGAVFLLSEAAAVGLNRADYCQYKAVYPPLHVAGNKILGQVLSPRGQYLLLDNFTERVDLDLSNNYGLLKVDGPPPAYGLYLDGNRITQLPKALPVDLRYTYATLDVLPYFLRQHSRALLVGTRGGFKVREALSHEGMILDALEPDPVLYRMVDRERLDLEQDLRTDIHLYNQTPLGFLRGHPGLYDLVDISPDFLGQADANRFAFTQEALRRYYGCLSVRGILVIPASIREFTVYALKEEESAYEMLRSLGVPDPEKHLVLYRSAWSTRLLVFKTPPSDADLHLLKKFCFRRSFDISYEAGRPIPRGQVWNELPPLPFEEAAGEPDETEDSLRDDSRKLLSKGHDAFLKGYFFNLRPSTLDHPFFYATLRLSRLGEALSNITLIPREEIGTLVNLAVLVQSLALALGVLSLPLLFRRRLGGRGAGWLALYFAALGLGFLFIEIVLIEKASYFLGDRATAFTLVLAGMLLFSGGGSAWAGRLAADRARWGLTRALGGLGLWLLAALAGLAPLLDVSLSWPTPLKCLLLLAVLAPAAFALGVPFALGLGRLGGRPEWVPWAWALNGAFSVVATPLAALLAVGWGYGPLLWLSLGLYAAAGWAFGKIGGNLEAVS